MARCNRWEYLYKTSDEKNTLSEISMKLKTRLHNKLMIRDFKIVYVSQWLVAQIIFLCLILGAYPIDDYPNILIDVHHLNELRCNKLNEYLAVGAGLTMTEFEDILEASAEQEGFEYFTKLHKHMKLVGHIPLKNVSTLLFLFF